MIALALLFALAGLRADLIDRALDRLALTIWLLRCPGGLRYWWATQRKK